MSQKKYASLQTLQTFLDNLKATFSTLSHNHKLSDITDYTIDSQLLSNSNNPVANKVLNDEFDAISQAMEILETTIDGKADSSHNHDSAYYTKVQMDSTLSNKSDKTHNHDSDYAGINHNHDNVYSLVDHHHDSKYDSKGTASSAVFAHNTATTAHNDIRDLISGLTTRLNTLADCDDTTLDQMSEVVDYIKNNKSLIDGITTSKVNVSDIVNNLTTNVTNKPLSAAQGVAIKSLIDALQEELDSHGHVIADVSGLQTALDGKANSSHGTHVSYSTAAPVMDGTASVGTASTVARSDHKHPTDTSRASKTEFDAHVNNTDVHFTTTERAKLSGIADGAQVNVQGDWNINDVSNDAYIKNRPFWTDDPVETQLVNSASFNTTEYDENIYVSRSPFSFELVEGAQYNVTWNGTTYTCTCRLLSGALNIGNASILGLGENTQEPFFIDYYSGANSVYTSSATSATVSIVGHISEVHKINNKYIDFPDGSYVGVANDNFGEVFNDYTNNVASGAYSHSEGLETTASGDISHAEGYGATASGNFSHAEGADTIASGHWSHAEGYGCDATGRISHAEGHGTVAASEVQHVQGRFNIPDTANKYAHIVGNGTSSIPANIHTLDWDGYAWFERGIYVGGSGMDDTSATRVTTEADHNWTLIYDSGEISSIANSISNIDVSGYTNFEILVRCYNDGDSLGPGDRAGAVIFTAQNGKSYQFPVWTDMLSKSISTVSAMAQFKLIDGWLVCPYASKLIDFVDVFDTAEGGTAGNLVPSGSGMMRCTSPLSTLTISSYGQSSNFYFGVGSRVMVWGWNA